MYSPVLAALLTPNVLLGEWWGKALFAACDCAVGVMIMRLLRRHPLQLPLACTWLLNPIVVNVSTRGNAEGFVAVWAVASLYAFERRRYNAAAVLLGIAAHIKIYPVVYGVPMALFLLRAQQSPDFAPKDFVQRAGSAAAFGASACAQFVCRSLSARDPRTVAAATFIAITSLCYAVYGYAFLFEVLRAPLYPLRTLLSLSHSPPCSGLLVPLRPLRYPPQLRSSFPSNVRGCRPPPPNHQSSSVGLHPLILGRQVPRRLLRAAIRKIGVSAASGGCCRCGRGPELRRALRAVHSDAVLCRPEQSVCRLRTPAAAHAQPAPTRCTGTRCSTSCGFSLSCL
jgi:hypothetical protein